MNNRNWYIFNFIVITVIVGSLLLIIFKGTSICNNESEGISIEEQQIEGELVGEEKHTQAERLFSEGKTLLEKAKDENEFQKAIEIITQSIDLFQEIYDRDGAGKAMKYLADFLFQEKSSVNV